MKRYLLFALPFLLFVNATAQTIDSVRVKDQWSFFTDEARIELQTIDSFSAGKLQCTLNRTWTDHDWKNSLFTSYSYDGSNNVLLILNQNWIDGVWVNRTQLINTYDINNKIISIINQTWQSNQWVSTNSQANIYDGNGYVMNSTNFSGPDLVNGNRITHYYDGLNQDTLDVVEKFENGIWIPYTQTHYQYDLNNNIILQQLETWLCLSWIPQNKEVWTYNPDHHILTHENFNWDYYLYSWKPYSLSTYYPDSLNHDTLSLTQYWDGISWKDNERIIASYSYFSDQYCKDVIHQEYNVTHWTTLSQCSTCVDTLGRSLFFGCGNSSHSYSYDVYGNELVYRYYWISQGGGIVSGVDSTFYKAVGQYHISTAGDFRICEGDSIHLGLWVSGIPTTLTYQWSPVSGLSSALILDPLASPDSSTQYILSVFDNAVPIGTYEINLTLDTLPFAHIVVSSIDNSSICPTAILISDTSDHSSYCYWYLNGSQETTQWGNSCTLPVNENGQYILQTRSTNTCYNYDTLDFTLLNGNPPAVNITANCNELIAFSPTAVSYQWYRYNSPISGAVNDTINVTSGNYSYRVLVTDVNGCTNFSDYVEVNQMTINIYGYPQCHDSCSGWLEVSTSSGAAPYTYLWSNGETTYHAGNLCPGNVYTVTVTDTRGCSVTGSDSLVNPAVLESNLQSGFVSDIDSCNALVIAFPTGGIGGQYYYEWGNGSHQQFAHLCYGWNTVTICRGNNCMITDSIFIGTDTVGFVCDVSLNSTSPVCGGYCSGTITTTINQGTQPIHYLWSNGSTQASQANLCNGPYNLYIIDSNGCTDSVTANITSPPPLSLNVNILTYNPNYPCSTLVEANITGGVPPYSQIQWCNGTSGIQTYVCPGLCLVTFADSLGCFSGDSMLIPASTGPSCSVSSTITNASFAQCNGSATIIPGGTAPFSYSWSTLDTTISLNNLCAGVYYYSVTDSFGCTLNDSVIITELPPSCSVTIITTNNILCSGDCTGSLTAIANGVPPFHFLWSTNDTNATINNLCAGTYSVVMTDGVGCVKTMSATVTEPPPLTATYTTLYGCTTCTTFGTVVGGTPPFTYLWCDGSTGQQSFFCGPGVCVVNVVDGNGCLTSDTIILAPPPPLSLNTTTNGTNCAGCFDGIITGTAFGGNPPYLYTLNPTGTTNISGSFTGLPAGNYQLCVTDANNCTTCDSITVADDPTGIASVVLNDEIKLYPNPFANETILEVNTEMISSQSEFTVTDILGHVIATYPIIRKKTIISRKNLAAGIYFYQVNSVKKNLSYGKMIVAD